MYTSNFLIVLIGLHSTSAFSIDTRTDVVASRPDVEVELDLDLNSNMQWDGYPSSHSNQPSHSKLPEGEPLEFNIHPIKGSIAPSVPLSTVLKPHSFNFGRGPAYVTTKAVENGTELLSVPMSHVMSKTSAAKGRVGLLLEANPDLPLPIALGLHLLEEKALGVASNFFDLITTLPTANEINSTLFYSEDELSEMEGSQLLRFTLARDQAVDAFYDALVQPVTSREAVDPPILQKDEFTPTQFRWAMGVVWSCSFQLGDDEADVVLAPVLSTIGICTTFDSDGGMTCPSTQVKVDTNTQRLVVYASAPLTKGQEVRLFMPGKSSTQLMLNHGFANERALPKLDKLDLTVTLDPSDALAQLKNYLLQSQLNESTNATYAFYYGSSTIEETVAASLKMKLLSGVELAHYKELLPRSEESETQDDRRIISLRNEFVFTRAIISTCTALLQQYPTSMDQDVQVLAKLTQQNDVESTRRAHVQRILIIEKKILNETMEIALEEWKTLVFSTHPNLIEV
ncbi:ribulose-bisphosphate carboxylase oxygenase small subunit n-methyltransferase i [Plasmopara halstedii]|uniref:Ribulose-bisphosphate carboxylase oxygenase small subunit n-methyltransferase i n=1 Tax=Plasmopara halstedii TaxID=4781 RepID=A0A0P1AAK6_PLAHL|nr:ribulose-bisphosphate carboxylase oxygenase small subunit n-methyltransferase i [Plasmopara halstedii]CEG37367.1 ribulose-bisphosphate carboxylase oxygenase small subunit n-methyltransferase i [Plasmopara halstedii]|eukprot:XP_024573736.1 ribulose-bisphosphate carboxylase oxygenase small subunit n-methyltransferase i [Plasmopara halstedii]